jgi:hypothetical protein
MSSILKISCSKDNVVARIIEFDKTNNSIIFNIYDYFVDSPVYKVNRLAPLNTNDGPSNDVDEVVHTLRRVVLPEHVVHDVAFIFTVKVLVSVLMIVLLYGTIMIISLNCLLLSILAIGTPLR